MLGIIKEEFRKAFPRSKLIIEGDTSTLESSEKFIRVAGELISNCGEKGASEIRLRASLDRIVVEDDFVHPPSEVKKIIKNICQTIPKTSKKDGELGQPHHGFGIYSIRNTLDDIGGSLESTKRWQNYRFSMFFS